MKKQIFTIIIFTLLSFNINAQIITTVAGNGTVGYSGDGGQATNANLNNPSGLIVDGTNCLYIIDANNNVIRKVNTNGIITTIAGNGNIGYTGDGGQATNAEFHLSNGGNGIVIDALGNLYISDVQNNVIRKINTTGIITTFAGNGTGAYAGDGNIATNASLSGPSGLAIDGLSNIYVSDFGNSRIRKINTSGIISTFAGNGNQGYAGDGSAAINAELYGPSGLAIDTKGNMYIEDAGNQRIRKINTSGAISTFAGSGTGIFSGDGGQATNAHISQSIGVAVDGLGNVFIADEGNERIRKVNTNGIIGTIAGNGTSGYSGDGSFATNAELNVPSEITLDAFGNMYIADTYNNRVRKVTNIAQAGIEQYSANNNISIYPNPTSTILNVELRMQNEASQIQITDVLGNEVITTKEKQIDVSILQSGVYFIKTTQGISKFIKQ